MANKKVEIMIDDVRLVAELYVDDAPIICNMILNNPGQRAIIQHAERAVILRHASLCLWI